MFPTPSALPPALPSELLEYILQYQVHPTTLLICQPRAIFLASLLQCVPHILPKPHKPARPPEGSAHADADTEHEIAVNIDEVGDEDPPKRHPLLIPTLHQIATSRQVNLVFTPTLSHLRAYLAVYPLGQKEAAPAQVLERKGNKPPLLVVYGLLECHRHTSEWSAQGLGNSLSGLVDAGFRSGKGVVLFEEFSEDMDVDQEEDEDGYEMNVRKKYAKSIWEERVPILNGSVRKAGFDSEDLGWSGRTIEVGRVLARWFKFDEGEWEN